MQRSSTRVSSTLKATIWRSRRKGQQKNQLGMMGRPYTILNKVNDGTLEDWHSVEDEENGGKKMRSILTTH